MDFLHRAHADLGVLYCLFVIGHDRRRILHYNVTRNPNALWITLQLHEAWENGDSLQRFLIFDRDAKSVPKWSRPSR
jgi:putative transposase